MRIYDETISYQELKYRENTVRTIGLDTPDLFKINKYTPDQVGGICKMVGIQKSYMRHYKTPRSMEVLFLWFHN